MKFFDIHSHKPAVPDDTVKIINILSGFDNIPSGGYYSAGLHPWHLDIGTIQHEWLLLQRACNDQNVVAIGECGLDKVYKTDWTLQMEYFIKQIALAISLQKPLIIHCVRAFDEVLKILKEQRVNVPVIFHGFNRSAEMAVNIIEQGYCLSYGKHLFNDAIKEVFSTVPRDRIFLETDDSDFRIEEIYEEAARILEIPLSEMKVLIDQNILRIFGNAFEQHE